MCRNSSETNFNLKIYRTNRRSKRLERAEKFQFHDISLIRSTPFVPVNFSVTRLVDEQDDTKYLSENEYRIGHLVQERPRFS